MAYAEGYLPWENPQIISFLKEIGKKYASGPSAAKKPASALSVPLDLFSKLVNFRLVNLKLTLTFWTEKRYFEALK